MLDLGGSDSYLLYQLLGRLISRGWWFEVSLGREFTRLHLNPQLGTVVCTCARD
jgi:hypothetical protein